MVLCANPLGNLMQQMSVKIIGSDLWSRVSSEIQLYFKTTWANLRQISGQLFQIRLPFGCDMLLYTMCLPMLLRQNTFDFDPLSRARPASLRRLATYHEPNYTRSLCSDKAKKSDNF